MQGMALYVSGTICVFGLAVTSIQYKLVDLQGWIAQLVRASGICPEGPGFNPWFGHFSVL